MLQSWWVTYLIFLWSGLAALLYEASWTRQFGTLLGHTSHAAAIVVSSFFLGMAVGYAAASRVAHGRHPLKLYALCEFAVAVWALLVPILLMQSHHVALTDWLRADGTTFSLMCRSAFCFFTLLPATTALGATLPLMAQWVSSSKQLDASRASVAYGINTSGALLGILIGTFYGLSHWGVKTTSYVAATISAFCGIFAWYVAATSTVPERSVQSKGTRVKGTRTASSVRLHDAASVGGASLDRYRWWLVAALTGGVAMGLQIAYLRMFALVFHNSSYTFGSVVAVYLAALAIGSFFVARLHDRLSSDRMLAWVGYLGSASVGLSMLLFIQTTKLEFFDYGNDFATHIVGILGLVSLTIGAPVVLLGMLLPTAWKASGESDETASRTVGRLTCINTVAGSLGALLVSFLVLPMLGVWSSIGVLGLFAVLPAWLSRHHAVIRKAGYSSISLTFVAISLWNATTYPTLPENREAKVVEQWNSTYGFIDVIASTRNSDFLILRENLHYQHGDSGPSRRREYRQTHLPVLLHPNPTSALFLGMGTGLTAGAALIHPSLEAIEVVELIPEVREAAKYFDRWNFALTSNPRVKIHIDDARHWLVKTEKRFDVIVSDLFVPWQSQTGYLYTVEHYQSVRRALQKGGIFCQWIGLYQLGEREMEMIANSFANVFPTTNLWFGRVSQGMVALIGSEQPLTLDGNQLAARLKQLPHAAPNNSGFDPYLASTTSVFRLYVGSWPQPPTGTILNTDEQPRIEFQMPVTYRNRKLLQGDEYVRFFDRVLSQLPSRGAQFTPEDGAPRETIELKRQLQRQVISR